MYFQNTFDTFVCMWNLSRSTFFYLYASISLYSVISKVATLQVLVLLCCLTCSKTFFHFYGTIFFFNKRRHKNKCLRYSTVNYCQKIHSYQLWGIYSLKKHHLVLEPLIHHHVQSKYIGICTTPIKNNCLQLNCNQFLCL